VSYFLVEDFAGGLDLRKSAVTAKPGGMRALRNAFVNPGGEAEQRRRFSLASTLPDATFGLAGIGGRLFVFGLVSPGSVSVQLPFVYQQLTGASIPGGETIGRILDTDIFATKLYVIAEFTDGTVLHFYDGAEITGAVGLTAKTHKTKVFKTDGELIRFSAINDPTDLVGTGSGLIDVTNADFGSADLIGLESCYDRLALFGTRHIQLWMMDPDPDLSAQIQVMANTGLIAPHATARYGSGDVLFLADTGIRSLRARDSSNAAVLNDIGSPIDNYIRELRRDLVVADIQKLQGLVDPLSGHVWFVWKDEILVLAYYPSSKITAWSVYDVGAVADYSTIAGNRIFLRAGDEVYVYGANISLGAEISNIVATLGSLAAEYDEAEVVLETPMLDFGRPATFKTFTGMDIACEGVWSIEINTNPTNLDAWALVATVSEATYSRSRVPIAGYSTHIALRLTASQGFSRLGAVGIHFEEADAE